MTKESVLEKPIETYSAFSGLEAERLATYKSDVETLTGMAFFTDPTRSLGPRSPGEQRVIRLGDIDTEAEHAVMGLFRCLYVGREDTSFRRTMKVLKHHVRESPHRAEAVDALRSMRRWEDEELARTPVRLVLNGKHLTPRAIIASYLYTRYLHKDLKRRKELQPFPEELVRGQFLGYVYALAQVYWIGRNIVTAVLDEPALLSSEATATV